MEGWKRKGWGRSKASVFVERWELEVGSIRPGGGEGIWIWVG